MVNDQSNMDINRPLIDAGVPELEGREGYFATYLSMKLHLARWLGTETGPGSTDPRVFLFTQLMVSHITDPEERARLDAKIWTEQARLMKVLAPNDKVASNEVKTIALRDACFVVQGDISTWYDKFVGVTSRNVIELV